MTDRASTAIAAVGTEFVSTAPVSGAAFTVGSLDAAREIVWASDAVAETIAQVQYSLGDGPARVTISAHRPVLVGDAAGAELADRWPIFADQIAGLPVGGLFTFPMQLGAITVGVCDTYRRESGLPSDDDLSQLLRAVDNATLSLLAGGGDTLGAVLVDGHRTTRAVVHQATGMLIVQLGVSATEAFARLRAHAYADGHDIERTATAIVEHRLRLEKDGSP